MSRDKKKNARNRLRERLSERPQSEPKPRRPMVQMKMAKQKKRTKMDISRSK